ncbi:MAG: RHS repeat-associated core domain-containing protein, partial [Clostridiales bacterium]|nr:RHS repeat-associated core domain-containing protein [Clostridiales bacterium]
TDMDGNITDTVKYDAYGSVTERTGDSKLIFGYNGQYGVLTDPNGLLYMRTRYYNPALKRFMKADILEGSIADSTSMNVFAYANGNPISFVDPFGLSADRGVNENPFGSRWSLEDQQKAFEAWDKAGRPSTAYRLVPLEYKILVSEALRRTASSMKGYYSRQYRSLDQTNYYSFHDAIFKTIDSLNNLTHVQEFDPGVKIRIEIEENVNIALLNIAGDLVGFVPVLGEIYELVDFMSEDNADLLKLGSVIGAVITEKDIAKLTPYAAELDKLGDLSKVGSLLGLINDSVGWNSSENFRRKISIYVQKDQQASFMYQAFVDKDFSFKVMFDAPTGTVIRPEDEMISVIYK